MINSNLNICSQNIQTNPSVHRKYKYINKNTVKLTMHCYWEVFIAFWCAEKDKPLKKLLNNTEKLLNNFISIENICMISYDTKIMKMLLLDEDFNNKIRTIYDSLFIENDEISHIREHIFSGSNSISRYSDKYIIDQIKNLYI